MQNAMQNDAIWELDCDEQLDPKNSHGFPQKELMMIDVSKRAHA